MKDDLDPETLLLPEVKNYIAYMEKTYIPTSLPIRKKSVLYNPDWTCLYENDDGVMTNNYSESNNARLKRKVGLHPTLFKFLCAMKEETAAMEVQWLQRSCPAPKKRWDDREKKQMRGEWIAAFEGRYRNGIDDEELLPALDDLLKIERPTHKNQRFVQTFPNRRSGRGRGPVRAQSCTRVIPSSSQLPESDEEMEYMEVLIAQIYKQFIFFHF